MPPHGHASAAAHVTAHAESAFADLLAEAAYADETLAVHEANAERAGQPDTVASWRAYKDYLGGLVEKLRMSERVQGAAAAESLAIELRGAIAQVPPRP